MIDEWLHSDIMRFFYTRYAAEETTIPTDNNLKNNGVFCMERKIIFLCAAALCAALAATGCQKPEQTEWVSSGGTTANTITEHRVTTTTTKKPDGTPGKDTPTTSTTTTKKPTTSTTTTTTKPPTTTTTGNPHTGDPWYYPYDVDAIIADCKAEIARVGLVWDDSLTKERSSWNNPTSTVAFTAYPEYVSLKNTLFNDEIPFYVENQELFSLKRCKIWFEPYDGYPGEYKIYFLYAAY